jgi:glycosyltransferase involved in cell wall biosynthesis
LPERRIRVLHLLAAGTAGGAEHHVLRLLAGLDRSRFEPWLAVFEARPDAARSLLGDFRAAGVRVVVLDERGRWSRVAMLRLGALLRRGRFEVVHSHSLRSDLAALAWKTVTRRPPILLRTVHNTDPHYAHWLIGRLGALAAHRLDHVIVISDAVGRFLRSSIHVPAERMSRIYYGLEPSQRIDGTHGPVRPTILVLARLDPQKGQDVLIDALPRILARIPEARVLFAGHETGCSVASLKQRARDRGVLSHVEFLGFRSDVRALLQGASVLALPSRWEGFGLVLLEAMDVGRPIVASAVGAIPEVVRDREGGLLVPPDEPEALAEALITVLAEPDRAKAMGEAGRRRLIESFSERAMIEATESLYNALLGNRKLRAGRHALAAPRAIR